MNNEIIISFGGKMKSKVKILLCNIMLTLLVIGAANIVHGQTQYTIAVTSEPSYGGSVTGGGSKDSGSPVTVTANVNPGYKFLGWFEGTTSVSIDLIYPFTCTGNRNLIAKFEFVELWKKSGTNIYYNGTGNIGIGTQQPDKPLTINGTVHAEEVIVDLSIVPDFVFEDNYNLRPLEEVESFIKINKHLPEIPSAKEVEENGLNSGDMQAKLLQKIEELTLYMIEMKKENNTLKKEIENLVNKK